MRRPIIIAMLTDFGLSDGYVASVKGVILSKAPTARIIDISHTISAHDIRAAGYVLWNCYKYFPEGTVFVSVVDPGVGTGRKVIAVGGDGYTFLAPDNGLLQFILATIRAPRVTEITNKKYFREHVSRTFHGRDIFAPVAAAIASGIKLSSLGIEVEPQTKPHPFQAIDFNAKRLYNGEIIHIDRFGNVITDFLSEGDQPGSLILKIGRNVEENYFWNAPV